MTELPKIELWCHEGRSDKIYCVTVEESGGGYVVNFAYGRRGAALNTGTKTSAPVSHAEAVAIYLKLVESKIAKGYEAVGGSALAGADAGGSVGTVPTVATVGTVLAESARIDTGLRPQLLNPIGEAEAEAYLSSPRWCVQEKYDGRRTLVRRTPEGGIVAANRKGQRIALSRAVESALGELPGAFVLDGELVGETYHVFDLLENADGDWRDMPYAARLVALQRLVGGQGGQGGNVLAAPTALGEANKRALYRHLKQADKEGAVFKDLEAPWTAGRPSSGGSQLKCKFWASCSCVVTGVNAQRSVEVSLSGRPVGNVTIPPNFNLPSVGRVVEIRYLYVAGENGSLYQPVYLGERDEIDADDCTLERQHLKYKPAA